MSTSDYSMLTVHWPTLRPRKPRYSPPFRFEAMWLREPRCAVVVEEAWMEGLYKPEGSQITNCLDSCQSRLSAWNKIEFGHVQRQIERYEKPWNRTHNTILSESMKYARLLIVGLMQKTRCGTKDPGTCG